MLNINRYPNEQSIANDADAAIGDAIQNNSMTVPRPDKKGGKPENPAKHFFKKRMKILFSFSCLTSTFNSFV